VRRSAKCSNSPSASCPRSLRCAQLTTSGTTSSPQPPRHHRRPSTMSPKSSGTSVSLWPHRTLVDHLSNDLCISALPVPTVQLALPHTADYFMSFQRCLPVAESSMQRVYGQLRGLVQPLEQPNDPNRGVLRHLTRVQLREEQHALRRIEEQWANQLQHPR
jgi:hypothetical protein